MSDDRKDVLEEVGRLPFEKAMEELEILVGELEKGSVTLDESVKLYARGKALQDRCEKLLAEAETRVEKITLGDNGGPSSLTPLVFDQ